MNKMRKWCLLGGVLFMAVGGVVAALAVSGASFKHEKTDNSGKDDWKVYEASIKGQLCHIGIPSVDAVLPIARGYYDQSTPVTAMVTSKSLTRFVKTREDVEKQFTIFDRSSAERQRFENTAWDELRAYYEKANIPEWTPVEERLLGVVYVQLPVGEVCQVVTVAVFRANGRESRAVGVTDLVRRDSGWMVMTNHSSESELWKPFREALLKSGNAVLLDCRRRAGVEAYDEVLSK